MSSNLEYIKKYNINEKENKCKPVFRTSIIKTVRGVSEIVVFGSGSHFYEPYQSSFNAIRNAYDWEINNIKDAKSVNKKLTDENNYNNLDNLRAKTVIKLRKWRALKPFRPSIYLKKMLGVSKKFPLSENQCLVALKVLKNKGL